MGHADLSLSPGVVVRYWNIRSMKRQGYSCLILRVGFGWKCIRDRRVRLSEVGDKRFRGKSTQIL